MGLLTVTFVFGRFLTRRIERSPASARFRAPRGERRFALGWRGSVHDFHQFAAAGRDAIPFFQDHVLVAGLAV